MHIVLIDDEEDLLDFIEFSLTSFLNLKSLQISKFKNPKEALTFLQNSPEVDWIICDHHMPELKGHEVLKGLTDLNHKGKFILSSSQDIHDFYPKEKVFFQIQKLDIAGSISELSKKLSVTQKMPKYIPLSFGVLEGLGFAPTELYLKISQDKFLQCLKPLDLWTKQDSLHYQNKGMPSLFIQSENAQELVTLLTKSLMSFYQKNESSPCVKAVVATELLQETIKNYGFDPGLAKLCEKNIEWSCYVFSKNKEMDQINEVIHLKSSYASKLHGLQTLISAKLLDELDWFSEASLFKLSLASFLQENIFESINVLKIYHYQDFLKQKDNLSFIEQESFLNSSQKMEKILNEFKKLPPDIAFFLDQQWEMPKGEGYPKRLKWSQVGKMSQVFILSGLISKAILQMENKQKIYQRVQEFKKLGFSQGSFQGVFEWFNPNGSVLWKKRA